jgi:hypothetical protein
MEDVPGYPFTRECVTDVEGVAGESCDSLDDDVDDLTTEDWEDTDSAVVLGAGGGGAEGGGVGGGSFMGGRPFARV